jgi:hypothetical protein
MVTAIGLFGLFGLLFAGAAAACSDSACDLNKDGAGAKPADYVVFFTAFGSKVGEPKYNPAADLDNSGSVTAADYALLLKFCPIK